jgi:chemotaxis signal transduction protein
VTVSNPAHEKRVGERIDEAWATRTLSLRDSQSYAVSAFAPSTLYGDRHTFIFGAVIRGDDHKILGGIGIVFDREAQLSAMLQDALPHTAGGAQADCIAVFVDDRQQVVAATSRYQPGDLFDLSTPSAAEQTQSVRVVMLDGIHYAMGFCRASGYREFEGLGIHAVVLIPLGPVIATRVSQRETQPRVVQNRTTSQHRTVDIATFHADGQWLGVRRDQIVAAIDASNLRAIPARPVWHVGVLIYQEMPVPVIDVARFTGSSHRSEGRDVIVLRDSCATNYVGLLVDQLADISEIEERHILPVKGVLLDGQRSIIDQAVRPSRAEDPVLFILDIAELFAQVRSAATAR